MSARSASKAAAPGASRASKPSKPSTALAIAAGSAKPAGTAKGTGAAKAARVAKVSAADALEFERLTAPSIQTIRAVYDALGDSVQRVDRDSRAVLDALRLLGDTLDVARGSANLGGGLAGLGALSLLGPMALPIPLAMRAVMSPVSRYVQQRTGISLAGWMEFVGSTQTQFEAYLAQLERVAALAVADSVAVEEGLADRDAEQLSADEALLRETKAKTRVWQPILAQCAQFGRALDAMLDGWKEAGLDLGRDLGRDLGFGAASDTPGAKSELAGWAQQIGGLLQGAAVKVTDQLAGARQAGQEYLLSAFSDVRERAEQFREQVDRLAVSFAELEDLLDLEIAQLRSRAGVLSAEEAALLRRRVAAAVLVPRLVAQIADGRARVAALGSRIERLEEARSRAAIGDAVYATLAAEYAAGLEEASTRVAALEAEAAVWRLRGRPMLDDAAARLQEQEELVRARQLVGELQERAARDRIDALQRELANVQEASRVLDDLREVELLPAPARASKPARTRGG
jgi:hypothetical protein